MSTTNIIFLHPKLIPAFAFFKTTSLMVLFFPYTLHSDSGLKLQNHFLFHLLLHLQCILCCQNTFSALDAIWNQSNTKHVLSPSYAHYCDSYIGDTQEILNSMQQKHRRSDSGNLTIFLVCLNKKYQHYLVQQVVTLCTDMTPFLPTRAYGLDV